MSFKKVKTITSVQPTYIQQRPSWIHATPALAFIFIQTGSVTSNGQTDNLLFSLPTPIIHLPICFLHLPFRLLPLSINRSVSSIYPSATINNPSLCFLHLPFHLLSTCPSIYLPVYQPYTPRPTNLATPARLFQTNAPTHKHTHRERQTDHQTPELSSLLAPRALIAFLLLILSLGPVLRRGVCVSISKGEDFRGVTTQRMYV